MEHSINANLFYWANGLTVLGLILYVIMSLMWYKYRFKHVRDTTMKEVVKKEKVLSLTFAERKKMSTLTIFFRDGKSISWTKPSDKYITPWQEFYKWYFFRESSNQFVMWYDKGCTLILKSEIIRFNVQVDFFLV